MDREEVFAYVRKTYKIEPAYLFKSSPEAAVLRHRPGRCGSGQQKWFAVVMRVSGRRLGLEIEEEVDVLNVKADPEQVSVLQTLTGFFPAYHMNKEHWISILLDEKTQRGTICGLIDGSFELTK